MWRRLSILACSSVLICGCNKSSAPTSESTDSRSAAADPWVLSETNPKDPNPAVLWNGQVGIRLSRSAAPFDSEGNSLEAFSITNYESGGEERILPLKNWYSTRTTQPPFDPEKIENYQQTLDMRTGILETRWAIADKDRHMLVIRESIIDPAGPPIWAERWTTKVATTADLNRTDDALTKDQFETSQYIPANFDNGNPPADDFKDLAKRAKTYWDGFWETDIEIDGPVEDQQAIRSFLFYLRSSIHPDNEMAISPMGLSSTYYFGHVFWDADVWVFPALMLLDPDRAATIPLYRINKKEAARRNYLNWVAAGRPVGNGKKLGNSPADPKAIMYPWESSVTGLETVPGPSRFQHHISATVVHGLQLASALGLVDIKDSNEIGRAVAHFYADRVTGTSLNHTMSPDENFTGDNDLYTNCVVNQVFKRYLPSQPLLKMPRDEKGNLINYEGDRGKGYKQAAGVLAIYPLQDEVATQSASDMMSRFANKTIPNGPAMTDSVNATIYSRLQQPDLAYAEWKKSWKDFTKQPLLLFSEKRKRSLTYFTTGAGGCLQTVLYGFAGIRIDEKPVTGANWTKELKNGYWLSCKPNLPKAWKSMNIKGIVVLGKKYDLKISNTDVFVSEVN